ncbi:hypothetical protein [Agrobacterium larrymoorei]|uniref:Uncharacterized protein n=1 Tax=Agrobacterium larrymoorei TaxID=160699 RepID=A0AAF0H7I0_9HYPH|nr:hypothetical protein [Agrobacterium larrymoorei]WHA40913.1 hypothetical protein CFBP5477_014045 [Agrobacterium larrymoorei]
MGTFGFHHPDHGYWETTNQPSQDILDGYPAGTVEYPAKPGNDYKPVDGGWAYVAPEPAPVILEPVTRRQLRLTLVREGISLATVEALIAAMPDGLQKEEAQIEWADAQTFERDHPTLRLIAQALDLSPAKVDEMWLKAMVA